MKPRLTLRVRSAWILLAAAASLLVAAGYGLFTAGQLIQDPQFFGDFEPTGFAVRAALVMQFIGPVQTLLLLLAVMLLAGCLVLTERVPVPPRTSAGGSPQPIGGRLQLGLLGLATLAGLSALMYAAAAALALTAPTPTNDTPIQLLSLSNSVTVLAVSLATLGLLAAVLLSWRVPGHLPPSPDAGPGPGRWPRHHLAG